MWAERALSTTGAQGANRVHCEKGVFPVVDHWWQTELGWPALSAPVVANQARGQEGDGSNHNNSIHMTPVKVGSAGIPVAG